MDKIRAIAMAVKYAIRTNLREQGVLWEGNDYDPDKLMMQTGTSASFNQLTRATIAAMPEATAQAAQIAALTEALQALSNAADDINGEQDRQLCDERRDWDLRLQDTIVGTVEVSEGQWGALNIAIFNAQKLLRDRAALAKQEPGS